MQREKHQPVILNDQELSDAWVLLHTRVTAPKAMLAVLTATGARPQEVANTLWADWDGGCQLLLRTLKREDRKPRFLNLNTLAIEILRTWKRRVAARRMLIADAHMFTALSSEKVPGDRAVRYAAKRLGRQIGRPTLQPYDLRRTFATRAASTLSLAVVQTLLGHKHASSTLRYMQASPADRARAAQVTEGHNGNADA